MWALIYKAERGGHKAGDLHLIGSGEFNPDNHNMNILEYYDIPDQDVSHLYQGNPPELVGTLDDLLLYTPQQQAQFVDRDTGKAIDEAMHPFVGIEEQIGILRVQIGEILNAIGLAPTAGFDQLNTIATEKIQEGQTKKEAL